MNPDDELCLCFHVTKRKVINYLRAVRPGRVSQLSDCYGAGTGCGWCRPYLEQLFRSWQTGSVGETELPDAGHYRSGRKAYIQAGYGTPPDSAADEQHAAE